LSSSYPASAREHDRWIRDLRPPRHRVDPWQAVAAFVEAEPGDGDGGPVPVAAIFLANRECPWRCLMCDLWKDTLTETVPPGAIEAQIRGALDRLPAARRVKLYNAGSFFDPRAIPRGELPSIAQRVASFERVIVESHPALVGSPAIEFRDRIAGRLEVAMGLETIHPDVLPRLNKGMSLEQFRRAAELLHREGIAVRAFVLLGLPFLSPEESLEWAERSVEAAFDWGAETVSIVPTRTGNGALDRLRETGEFNPPSVRMLERALGFGLELRRGRVLADLWDLRRFRICPACFDPRRERLHAMNLAQARVPGIHCSVCGGSA
jgi:radical SAM enzyme (TIGR01210 family)